MISVERVLDSLAVTVEPLEVRGRGVPGTAPLSMPALRCWSGGGAVYLVGGASVLLGSQAMVVLPPRGRDRPRARPEPRSDEGGRRAEPSWAPLTERPPGRRDVVVAHGRIRVTCGSVDLFARLREPLIEPVGECDPIRSCFAEALEELCRFRPGSRAVLEAILHHSLVLFLRRYCERGERRLSWLVELEDERLGRALAAMRQRPERPFTIAHLAELAGMSRSAFAAHFMGTVGRSPMEFLKGLRVAQAAQLLLRTDLGVKTIASRVGYASRSAFTRAFRERHGVGPTEFRAAAREGSRASEP